MRPYACFVVFTWFYVPLLSARDFSSASYGAFLLDFLCAERRINTSGFVCKSAFVRVPASV